MKYLSISIKELNEFAHRLANAEKQSVSFVTETVETRIALYLKVQKKAKKQYI